jgi:hypothetical protein
MTVPMHLPRQMGSPVAGGAGNRRSYRTAYSSPVERQDKSRWNARCDQPCVGPWPSCRLDRSPQVSRYGFSWRGIPTKRYVGLFPLTKFHNLSGVFVDATLEGVSTESGFDYKPICRQ